MRRLVLAAAVLMGCAASGVIPVPDEADAARSGVTVEALRQGRERYVSRCGGCHRLYPPSHARREEWPKVLERMREFMDLTPEDERLVSDYLVTFAGK